MLSFLENCNASWVIISLWVEKSYPVIITQISVVQINYFEQAAIILKTFIYEVFVLRIQ